MEYSTQNDILHPILENGIEGFSEVLQKNVEFSNETGTGKGTEIFSVSNVNITMQGMYYKRRTLIFSFSHNIGTK